MVRKTKSEGAHWWGDFNFKRNEIIGWNFSSLQLSVQHLDKEWCMWHSHHGEFVKDSAARPEITRTMDATAKPDKFQRFVFTETADSLEIFPNLPDRNIVARPISPIVLMPRQEVTLFVGAVLWFCGRPKGKTENLFEVPIRQLSDTWFGPSPRIGELCYASRTHAYVDTDSLTHRAYRAIVPITIKNANHKDALPIEKISVPVTMLDLYFDGKEQFWTNSIVLLKEAGSSHVEVKMESARRSPFFDIKNASLIAKARKPDQGHLVLRAYDMLFS